ncbi:MAG: bifunctional 2-polyprenyl-6-hydroxyphenol methylase/3-demethylubiquinol 3-O-methyltransferase UbiG [Gammaproteobacteria bacterium]|nr:bifunctional 2-polyprenyl-6-hydroxyphenol methylase/3-demethylubiquinol 3-O-methyltransferase UbiG [Gammaproteobacteria bacterium]
MIQDTTIDAREVEFYSRMAATWWDREGPFWPLHKLNELRTAYICDKLSQHFDRGDNSEKPLEGLRVLDVGCGGGILSESMARLGARVTGIDVVEKNIRIASLHAAHEDLDIDYRLATAAELAAEGRVFDVVLNMEVVEHVADVDAFMRDCAQLTAESGVMFVATINRTPAAWLFAIVGAEYVLRWLPRGTHRWSMFQKPAEIEARLAAGGLMARNTVGVAVNPFAKSLRLTRSLAVNYMMFCTRLA